MLYSVLKSPKKGLAWLHKIWFKQSHIECRPRLKKSISNYVIKKGLRCNINSISRLYTRSALCFSTMSTPDMLSDKYNGIEWNETSMINNDLINQDSELKSLLEDIMKDFDNSVSHPPKPPGSKCAVNIAESQNNEEQDSMQKGPKTDECCGYTGTITKQNTQQIKDTDTESISQKQQKPSKEVFDLLELTTILKTKNLRDIAVIKVSEELAYCNYLVLATANSIRHLKAVTEDLCKLHKAKKSENDKYISVEGKECNDWKVIDMGTLVLHLFISEVREHYDIETLWTVGEKYDNISCGETEKLESFLNQHTYFFDSKQYAVNS